MITDQTIFSVVHVRSEQVGEGLAEEQTIGARWFDSLQDAEFYFRNLRLAITIDTGDERGFIRIWETKYLYRFGLGDEAKDQIADFPQYDAERLPRDLNLDPRAGTLLDQESKQKMVGPVDKFWSVLRDAGYAVLNYREGPAAPLEDWMTALEFPSHLNPLPYVPAHSQTARIVRKENSWFFIYAHESTTEHGFWVFSKNVFNQIRGQEIINWVMVFLKESETEGFWAEPNNVAQFIRREDWTLNANGNYILNYARGVSGCVPFHSQSELLGLVDDFAQRSLVSPQLTQPNE
jgi:hypothetical protein